MPDGPDPCNVSDVSVASALSCPTASPGPPDMPDAPCLPASEPVPSGLLEIPGTAGSPDFLADPGSPVVPCCAEVPAPVESPPCAVTSDASATSCCPICEGIPSGPSVPSSRPYPSYPSYPSIWLPRQFSRFDTAAEASSSKDISATLRTKDLCCSISMECSCIDIASRIPGFVIIGRIPNASREPIGSNSSASMPWTSRSWYRSFPLSHKASRELPSVVKPRDL